MGQIEVMKITKIAEGWLSRNAASAMGSQARGGTVRRTWKIGSSPRIAQIDCPTTAPTSTPTTAANPKPIATRCNETSTRQPRPMSWGPATKNGSVMRSLASFQTWEGGGNVAPARPNPICQMIRSTASVSSGGMVAAAILRNTGTIRCANVMTSALGAFVTGALLETFCVFMAVMDMSLPFSKEMGACGDRLTRCV